MGGVFNSGNINLFAYTHQNPVKYVDPDGRHPATRIGEVIIRAEKQLIKYWPRIRRVVSRSPKPVPVPLPKPKKKKKKPKRNKTSVMNIHLHDDNNFKEHHKIMEHAVTESYHGVSKAQMIAALEKIADYVRENKDREFQKEFFKDDGPYDKARSFIENSQGVGKGGHVFGKTFYVRRKKYRLDIVNQQDPYKTNLTTNE